MQSDRDYEPDWVPKVGDVKKFPQALGLDRLDPFPRASKQGQCLTTIEEDKGYPTSSLIAVYLLQPNILYVCPFHR